ncbi:MAG TPA: protein phosphatase 2C domain-containing protein [Gemmatimonadales bacterium]|nr:protein phosphatase 2C domain-containing protein [Gemmatimonadales bacterium]
MRCIGPPSGRIRLAREPPPARGGRDPSALIVEFAQRTTGGALHAGNEDAICSWSSDQEILFAVADGVGGHEDGAVASATALESLLRTWEAEPLTASPVNRLRRSVERANLAVYDAGQGRMRTTLTISVLGPRSVTVAHVGDSRLLLFRDGTLRQLTADHNLAGRSAQYGLPSVTDLPDDPGRRLLTRALGQDPYVRIDTFSLPLQPGDRCVQCSDGLATLSGAHIIRILVHHDPLSAAERLVHDARQAGGCDDVSVQVVQVSAGRDPGPIVSCAADHVSTG